MRFSTCIVFLLLALAQANSVHGTPKSENEQPDMGALAILQDKIVSVSKKLQKNVVHIKAVLKQHGRKLEVSGTGLIMDEKGYIVTNHHVVEQAEKIDVYVPGKKQPYEAVTHGVDRQTDIALIKIEPSERYPKPDFGDSDQVEVGQWVLAIGNPYGLEGTVSFGIVSAKGRNLPLADLINDFIQTDAMIDFGSSGGPLVDMSGKVLGINSRTQGRGIGFTIPINTVLKVKKHLLEAGQFERAWLGVTLQPLDRDLAEYLEVPKETGVIVNSVLEDSPAEKAGVRVGDILTFLGSVALDAEDQEEIKDVIRKIADSGIGEKHKLAFIRDGKKRSVSVKLAKQPKVDELEVDIEDFGLSVKEITNEIFVGYRLEERKGIFVSYVEEGSIASQAGLARGDVIFQVGKSKTYDMDSFQKALESQGKGKVFLKIRRGKDIVYVLMKPTPSNRSQTAGYRSR